MRQRLSGGSWGVFPVLSSVCLAITSGGVTAAISGVLLMPTPRLSRNAAPIPVLAGATYA